MTALPEQPIAVMEVISKVTQAVQAVLQKEAARRATFRLHVSGEGCVVVEIDPVNVLVGCIGDGSEEEGSEEDGSEEDGNEVWSEPIASHGEPIDDDVCFYYDDGEAFTPPVMCAAVSKAAGELTWRGPPHTMTPEACARLLAASVPFVARAHAFPE